MDSLELNSNLRTLTLSSDPSALLSTLRSLPAGHRLDYDTECELVELAVDCENIDLLAWCRANHYLGDEFDSTALDLAALRGHASSVRFLCREGLDLTLDARGERAMWAATNCGHKAVVEALVEFGVGSE
jgi:hypothetical protein